MPYLHRHATLDNGLTIIAETDPDAHTAACGFFVKTGARDESPEVMGVSHFLEHMMFKGTERRTADQVNQEFDDIGANYNAYTSSELTCFYASTLPEHLPAAVDILGDILRPALRDDDFTTEKNVILEEIAMYRDNPFWVLYETCMERYYDRHPLGHRVLGTTGSVTALTRDQMRGYFESRYSADNTVVALAGDLDFDAVRRQIGAACAAWRRTEPQRADDAPAVAETEFELRQDNVHRGYLLVTAPAPAATDDRRYAAMMLAQVLGGADNSRLHWALVETGLADEAQAAYDPRDGCGDWFVFASGDPDKLDDIHGVVRREIDGLVDSLDEHDLERLRNKLATAVTLAGERPGGRMQRLGRLWTYLGGYQSLDQELERINGVSLDDLRAVHAAFPFEPRTVGRLLPGA